MLAKIVATSFDLALTIVDASNSKIGKPSSSDFLMNPSLVNKPSLL